MQLIFQDSSGALNPRRRVLDLLVKRISHQVRERFCQRLHRIERRICARQWFSQ
jgi:ABC-type dipeptide/oligopeptide/nickel transport system ATPase subunit